MRLQEIRHGRNWIRHGDLVRVRPSRAGKHDGFVAKFQYAEVAPSKFYALSEIDSLGRVQCQRFVRPERVKRLARKG